MCQCCPRMKREQTNANGIGKISVPCSSSSTKVAKTRRKGKKAKAKTAAAAKDDYYFLNNKYFFQNQVCTLRERFQGTHPFLLLCSFVKQIMYPPEYCIRYQLETFILTKRITDEPHWLTTTPGRCSLPFLSSFTKNRGVFYEQTVKAQVSFSNLKSQRRSALCSYPVTILQSPVITLSGLSSALTSLQQPFAKHFTMIFPSAIPLSPHS